jgi:phenylacetate-CoA ligase
MVGCTPTPTGTCSSPWTRIIARPAGPTLAHRPPDQPGAALRYDLGDSVAVKPDLCPCGNPLPATRVEGRINDTLSFEARDGGTVQLLPLALSTVVEETPRVRRFQTIKNGLRNLRVRLEAKPGADDRKVWAAVEARLRKYLAEQGSPTVDVERNPQPPGPDPKSGKVRQVWSAL